MSFGQLSPIPNNLSPEVQPAISQKVPVYRLTEPYFDKFDRLNPKGSYIKLKSEPAPSMEPMNKLAEIEMRKYLTKLDDIGAKHAERANKPYRSMLEKYDHNKELQNLIDDDSEEGTIAKPGEDKLQILGAKKYESDDEDVVTDPALIKQKAMRERMAKARKTMLENREKKKAADLV